MQQLTPEGHQQVTALAQRYEVSTEAVLTLLQALRQGHGTMAQFDHPDLGGRGQWMPGGMVMVGDMFNHALKAKVEGLCTALATLLATSPFVPAVPAVSVRVDVAAPATSPGAWWPPDLGMPAASGAQHPLRYAYFPAQHRLALAVHEHYWIYDTLDHQVRGVAQQQGLGSTVMFTSQHGVMEVTALPLLASGRVGHPVAGSAASPPPTAAPLPESDLAAAQVTDVFALLERLAELRHKGILSEDEFATKKAELLRRL